MMHKFKSVSGGISERNKCKFLDQPSFDIT